MSGHVRLLVVVFVVGVIYPPAAVAIACAVSSAIAAVWVLWLCSRADD